MPDLQAFEAFSRAMRGVERSFTGGLLREFGEMRREWRDTFERFGLTPSYTSVVLESTERLKGRARQMAGEAGETVGKNVLVYAKKQAENLAKVKVNVPPVQLPRRVARALEPLTSAAWADLVRSQVVVEMGRIQAQMGTSGGETDEAVIAGRLFATDLVDGKASAFRKAQNTIASETLIALWGAANGILGGIFGEWAEVSGEKFQRQAIAAIDEHTTECCLRVHGQIVGLDEPFHLTGQPRFAPYVQNPPFHFQCRTSQALYLPEMEAIGVPTGEMRDAAQAELSARKRTGRRVEIHPAHATSRRR